MYLRKLLMVCVLAAVVVLPLVGCNDTKPVGDGAATPAPTSNTTSTE